jgi:hypothetical protein
LGQAGAGGEGLAATLPLTGNGAGNTSAAPTGAQGPAWHEVDALLRARPARHGRQAKQAGGVPADLQLLLIHMTNKNANLHGVPEGIGPALFKWFAQAHT